MKISTQRLNKLLGNGLKVTPAELAARLLTLGIATESIQECPACPGIVSAKILEIKKHPNADKLRIATVTDGKETLEVVCGAPNIEAGQMVLWAKVGSKIADGTVLKETPIRGIKSPGMICSATELGVGEDHSGIWVLDPSAVPGQPVEQLIPLEDSILEIEITPNRPDWLSLIGVAREAAASLGLPVPGLPSDEKETASLPAYPVEVENLEDCPIYTGRKIENVKIGPSPLWIQTLLTRYGVRPINNIVDITNLVLFETGQPLHAFDANKLEGGKIIVRRAKAGEKILALNGKEYALDPGILIIADAKRPVAVAGIMGGEETAVSASTKNILLESAVFNLKTVRLGRKKLNLASDSSYRFERGVSRWNCHRGGAQATALISEIAGGKMTGYKNISKPEQRPTVSVRAEKTSRCLGLPVTSDQVKTSLEKLGIPSKDAGNGTVEAQSPEWRLDLNLEIDMIEEVARMIGYDKIPSAGAEARLMPPMKNSGFTPLKKDLRRALGALGFNESLNYGLVSKRSAGLFLLEEAWAELANPLSEEHAVLRPNLIIELLQNLKNNLSYQKKDVRLFEIGTVFKKEGGAYAEKTSIAGAACGNVIPPTWEKKDAGPINFFWMKGVIGKLLEATGSKDWAFGPLSSAVSRMMLHPSFGMELRAGKDNTSIGYFGLIHPETAKTFDAAPETVLFELDLEALETMAQGSKTIREVVRTPSIQRDCSVWVDEDTAWNDLQSEIIASGKPLLAGLQLFDRYRDDKNPGKKSLSFTLTFRASDKTLDDQSANDARDRVIASIGKKFGAELRHK